MEAIHGLELQVQQWKDDHFNILGLVGKEVQFQWKFDGTIDAYKTAEKLVMKRNIDIKKRFYLACTYCLDGIIQRLWKEMRLSGKKIRVGRRNNPMVHFWVKRMRRGFRIPWEKAVLDYLERFTANRYHRFFPALQVERRKNILVSSTYGAPDDFLMCLYTMTKREQEKLLLLCPFKLLKLFLDWPQRRLFIETAESVFGYLDEFSYRKLVSDLVDRKFGREIFDFQELFECFWSSSPDYLKAKAMEVPYLKDKIEASLGEMRRKRKAHFEELKNFKRKRSF